MANATPSKTNNSEQPIGAQKVQEAFQSMGYPLDNFEVAYWAQKPMSELSILYDNLYERKKKQIEAEHKNKGNFGQIFMRGPQALIRLSDNTDTAGATNASTVWLVDSETKTLRPFLSEQAFNNYYAGITTLAREAAKGTIVDLPSSVLTNPKSTLYQYKILKDNEGIKNDGTHPGDNTPSPTKISTHYGQERSEQKEKASLTILDNFLGIIKSNPDSKIDPGFIDNILNDDMQSAFYVNAMTYGGYGLNDIYRDIKRKSLIKNGQTNLEKIKIIDPSINADTFHNSTEGRAAQTNPLLNPPATLGKLDTSLLDLSIYKMPQEAFDILVQPIDWTSPEAKTEAAKIKSAYYDVLTKQLEAVTEQEKAVADYNYQQFKDELAQQYNIQLSDNANTAWNQINSLTSGYRNIGLSNSGFQYEDINKTLRTIRRKDEQNRKMEKSIAEQGKMKYYLKSATPDEIAALSPEERKKWGLEPSQEVLDFLNIDNLMKNYNLTRQEAEDYRNMTLDKNGYYRSNLYSTLFTNKYAVKQKKKLFQQSTLLQNKLNEEKKRYNEFNASGAFSSGYNPNAPKPSDSNYWSINPKNKINQQGTGQSTEGTPKPSDSNYWSINPKNKINKTNQQNKIDTAWENFKKKHKNKDWSNYEAIPGGQNNQYEDIQAPPGSNTLYGKKKKTKTQFSNSNNLNNEISTESLSKIKAATSWPSLETMSPTHPSRIVYPLQPGSNTTPSVPTKWPLQPGSNTTPPVPTKWPLQPGSNTIPSVHTLLPPRQERDITSPIRDMRPLRRTLWPLRPESNITPPSPRNSDYWSINPKRKKAPKPSNSDYWSINPNHK